MSEDEHGYEPSDAGKKGGLFAGLLAALGLGGLRLADNCASVGARSMRHVDDVAIGAGRVGGGALDDAGRLGGRAGGALDDGTRLGGRAGGLDDAGRPGLMIHEGAAVGEEGHWLESVGEFAIEAGFEVVSYDSGGSFTPEELAELPPPRPAVDGALAVDIDQNGWLWMRLLGDEPTSAGPWIISGRAERDGMIIQDEVVGFQQLAAACRRHGTTCVFVGCESNCAGQTEAVYFESNPSLGRPMDVYVGNFVAARLVAEPKPMWIAIAGEKLTLLRGKP